MMIGAYLGGMFMTNSKYYNASMVMHIDNTSSRIISSCLVLQLYISVTVIGSLWQHLIKRFTTLVHQQQLDATSPGIQHIGNPRRSLWLVSVRA